MSAKHEVYYPSNARTIKAVLSCHDNKVPKTLSTTRYCYGPGDICSKYKVCLYVFVAMDTRFP